MHLDVVYLMIGLQTWLCGGQIEIAVCSRVGHIFRKTRPYSAPNGEDTMTKNTLRMVHVWLGDNQVKLSLLLIY